MNLPEWMPIYCSACADRCFSNIVFIQLRWRHWASLVSSPVLAELSCSSRRALQGPWASKALEGTRNWSHLRQGAGDVCWNLWFQRLLNGGFSNLQRISGVIPQLYWHRAYMKWRSNRWCICCFQRKLLFCCRRQLHFTLCIQLSWTPNSSAVQESTNCQIR